MRINRIYVEQSLAVGAVCYLPSVAAHHVATVLRMKAGQVLHLFNGQGGEYEAEILAVERREVEVLPKTFVDKDVESSLAVTLVQGISRGQKMDITLQKAVELGVTEIQPVLSEQGNVKLDDTGRGKRLQHWQGVIISACEQCGRNRLPSLKPIQNLRSTIEHFNDGALGILLHPGSDKTLSSFSTAPERVVLMAGPEGGFSDREVEFALEKGFHAVTVGPRILRTETAALAAITACQVLWGDLSQ